MKKAWLRSCLGNIFAIVFKGVNSIKILLLNWQSIRIGLILINQRDKTQIKESPIGKLQEGNR